MKAFSAMLAAMIFPLMLLNVFGSIVAGIWLASMGEWQAIFIGFVILIGGFFAVTFLLAPGFALAGIGAMALQRGNKVIGWPLTLLASSWSYIIMITWEILIFNVLGSRFTHKNIIPMWLWSYTPATGIWSYLAGNERQTENAANAFTAQITYIVMAICRIWLKLPQAQCAIFLVLSVLFSKIFSIFVDRVIAHQRSPLMDPQIQAAIADHQLQIRKIRRRES